MDSATCVSFDLDDTLWPVEPTILAAEQGLYDWLGEHCPRVTKRETVLSLRENMLRLKIQRADIAHDVTALRLTYLQELMRSHDYPQERATQALQRFRTLRNQVTLFEGVLDSVDRIRKHYTVGAITNGNAQLGAIGIEEYFDFVVTAEDVGSAKPDRGIFQHAIQKAGALPHQMIHVGDDAKTDVLGALNAGMHAVWVNSSGAAWPGGQTPSAVIRSVNELPGLLLP